MLENPLSNKRLYQLYTSCNVRWQKFCCCFTALSAILGCICRHFDCSVASKCVRFSWTGWIWRYRGKDLSMRVAGVQNVSGDLQSTHAGYLYDNMSSPFIYVGHFWNGRCFLFHIGCNSVQIARTELKRVRTIHVIFAKKVYVLALRNVQSHQFMHQLPLRQLDSLQVVIIQIFDRERITETAHTRTFIKHPFEKINFYWWCIAQSCYLQ